MIGVFNKKRKLGHIERYQMHSRIEGQPREEIEKGDHLQAIERTAEETSPADNFVCMVRNLRNF